MDKNISEQRLIENEATQRTENEKARRTLQSVVDQEDIINFICECSDQGCREHIALTNAQFTEFHKNPKQFVVRPHHEIVAIEKVVRVADDYSIVEKHIDPASFGS